MNSSVDTAPLVLLTKFEDLELADIIRASMAGNAEMSLALVEPTNSKSFEIIYCGVTFVISITQGVGNVSGLKEIFCGFDPGQVRSAVNIALGAHVAGGERVPAIVRTLLDVAIKVGVLCGAVATVWRPASIVSGFEYFEEAASGYLSDGPFPVLAMVNFKTRSGGIITTSGLETLSGQELQIECGLMDTAELMRRVVRVAHDIAVNGPVLAKTSLDGLEPGETLELDPVSGSGLLKMKCRSVLDA